MHDIVYTDLVCLLMYNKNLSLHACESHIAVFLLLSYILAQSFSHMHNTCYAHHQYTGIYYVYQLYRRDIRKQILRILLYLKYHLCPLHTSHESQNILH